jgi:UDP-perosamine 4-acetyltransferase
MNLPIIVIGAGGHGRVIADTLRVADRAIIGFLDPDPFLHKTFIDGLPVLGDDGVLGGYSPNSVHVANGIGSTSSTTHREEIFKRISALGFRFETVCHPSATIAPVVKIGLGAQVLAGAIVQLGCSIGENTIVNTGAIVDHDCVIGAHCHLAPGTILSGNVHVGNGCHIGVGACIIQGIEIGPNSMLAAGTVVTQNVTSCSRVAGVPARLMENR